ncbi:MAG: efflux RND transporter periplasmic adaptor subunit [Myxococcota bacterium]|nr:efflux RND transporter periplasmic adaptor subunit [Myxococcota bacterium]
MRIGSVRQSFETHGELVAEQRVQLASRESGVLVELLVEEGDVVRAGELLARLDDDVQTRQQAEARKGVEAAESRREQAEAQVEAAERQLERTKRVVERGGAARVELERKEDEVLLARAALALAVAQKAQSTASLTSAGIALQRREIRAPFDAIVELRPLSLGATVGPQQAIFSLYSPASLRFMVYLPESFQAQLPEQANAEIRFDAAPAQPVAARLLRTGESVDPASRTLALYFELLGEAELPTEGAKSVGPRNLGEQAKRPINKKYRPGMFGRVLIELARVDDAQVVPLLSLDRRKGTSVWAVRDGKLARLEVELLLSNQTEAAVRGLRDGEQVVVSGFRGLEDGKAADVLDLSGELGAGPAAGAKKAGETGGKGERGRASD